MRPSLFAPSIVRLRVLPDAPDAAPDPRPRGSRRPHTEAKIAGVRRLVEETALTYGEISARTGVARASICRWTRDGGWQRPAFAPCATDRVPSARASAKLKRRTLSLRLTALAERHIRELEESACVDPEKLGEALELLKMAKLAAMGRRRRRKAGVSGAPPREPMRPIAELCVADVDLSRAPRAAIDDFLENRAPLSKEEKPPRGRRLTGDEHHAWMLERDG